VQEERAAKVREVGAGLQMHHGGWAVNMLPKANGSAAALVDLITAGFAGKCAAAAGEKWRGP
jgi:hypothetical protein